MSSAEPIDWSVRGIQRDYCKSQARYRTLVAGRRFGKNHTAITSEADYCLNPQAYDKGRDNPNEVLVWWVGPTYNQTKKYGFEKAKEAVPDRAIADTRATQPFEINLVNGVTWEFYSFDRPKSLDGAGVDSMVIDERGYMPTEIWEQNLAAMLLDTDGRVSFIGKPWPNDHFQTTFDKGQDPEHPEYDSWHATSYDNPKIPDARIDEIFGDLPERIYRREILAEFGAAGAVYNRDMIEWVDRDDIADKSMQAVVGVDPAGVTSRKKAEETDSDYWAVVVGFIPKLRDVIYVADAQQRRGIGMKTGAAWIGDIVDEIDTSVDVLVESNATQEWLFDELRDEGVPATQINTSRSKEDKLLDLSIPISNGIVQFIQWPNSKPFSDLIDQMCEFPDADHDDLHDALSLVVDNASFSTTSIFSGSYGGDDGEW
jgi:predicted phage terminase large subunit-like protein